VLDKSPEWVLDNNLIHIQNEFKKNIPSILLCSEPFHKTEFLNRLINSIENSIIFVDMDLLYTGYVESGMIQRKENVLILNPDKHNWRKELSDIIIKTSKEKVLVIIDSFNGIYNIFDDLESIRFINSCIMLLGSLGKNSDSTIIVTGMARKKENDEWVISPGGKQIIKSEKTGIFYLKKIEEKIIISNVGKTKVKNFKIETK
jgi:hypothetical protein